MLSNCTADAISNAAAALHSGALVAFPTETVYGLGADATNESAVAHIYSVKGRPADHPLIVHIGQLSQLDQWAIKIPDYAIALARDFWPGPMTLILNRSEKVKDFITGGQTSVGVRIPANPIALALLREFGGGIAAPSANRFGAISPTTAQAVKDEIGEYLDAKQDLILDGGPSLVGVESTIIECLEDFPRVLRPGAITVEMIEESTGLKVENSKSQTRASGLLDAHYAPKAKVFLLDPENPVVGCIAGEGFIAPASHPTPDGAIRLAAPISAGDGVAIAIRDRLQRAAFEGGSLR
ncbi:MAG: threonylcarbamoyl-AMP synthase [Actinobacteria bacterium]|nr:threonylcarbamoyl-AMP synthase [Actinomycetota bacterium]